MQLNYDEENLRFLKEKIKAIRFAIFKAEIHSELQLPNNIVQVLKVDTEGMMWFLTSCTGQHAKTVDKEFYAYMDFYRKGIDCRLQVSGKAEVIDDDDQSFLSMSDYSKTLSGRLVLIKMKIMQAEYFESKPESTGSFIDKCKDVFNHIFISAGPHRIYDFS